MKNQRINTRRRCLAELMDVARAAGLDTNAGFMFALTWILAPHIVRKGSVPGIEAVSDFLAFRAWRLLGEHLAESDTRWMLPASQDGAQLRRTFAVVQPLLDDGILKAVEAADLAWEVFGQARGLSNGLPAIDPALCDLIALTMDMQESDQVWVPFDTTGQLAFRAARCGATVWLARPRGRSLAMIKLILLGTSTPAEQFRFDSVDQLADETESGTLTHGIFTAPMGAPASLETWSEFEQVRRIRNFAPPPFELDRSDARAVATFWPVVKKAAAFLVSPSLLFTKGQESRLRHALLHTGPGNAVSCVVSLPNGLLTQTTIGPSLLVLTPDEGRQGTRLVDLSGKLMDGFFKERFAKDINVEQALSLMGSVESVAEVAVMATPEECKQSDYSLLPARYTRRVVYVGENRLPLGQLLTRGELRSTPPGNDPDWIDVWEIGPTLLDRWQAIERPSEKVIRIATRRLKNANLRPLDVVVAVKGSLGKVGLMGALSGADGAGDQEGTTTYAVPSQSCIGLRPDGSKVLPEYLFVFMKSNDFTRQLDSLRVGATIPHVTPATLLSSILVPVPPIAEQAKIVEQYWEIKRIEAQIDELQRDLKRRQANLFAPPLHESVGKD